MSTWHTHHVVVVVVVITIASHHRQPCRRRRSLSSSSFVVVVVVFVVIVVRRRSMSLLSSSFVVRRAFVVRCRHRTSKAGLRISSISLSLPHSLTVSHSHSQSLNAIVPATAHRHPQSHSLTVHCQPPFTHSSLTHSPTHSPQRICKNTNFS